MVRKFLTEQSTGQIPLGKHDEIAIVYGKPPESVPSRYHFPEGL